MFHKLLPQKVQHDDGSIVQVASRTKIEYIEATRKTSVEVDFGASIGVYAKTLEGWIIGAERVPMTESERKEVLEKIVAGLKAMSSAVAVEVC